MFSETQKFFHWPRFLMCLLLLLLLGLVVWEIVQPSGKGPPALALAILAAAIWVLVAAYLEVQVDDRELRLRYFPFTKKTIPLDTVTRAEAVTYRPIRDCGGWGVRGYKWKGCAYTVSGDRGVEVETRDGKLLLIGSQKADELAGFLRTKIPH